MSAYSSDKCSVEELIEFKKKVLAYLIANGIDLKTIKIRFQKNYGGNAKVLTYKTEIQNNKRTRRYLTAEKDDVPKDGWYSSKFSTKLQMGVYFYRDEWDWYLEPEQSDQRGWDLADIKKHIDIKKMKESGEIPV